MTVGDFLYLCIMKDNRIVACGVSADELTRAMAIMNDLAKTVGPYSEEELKLRRINGKRNKIWKKEVLYLLTLRP